MKTSCINVMSITKTDNNNQEETTIVEINVMGISKVRHSNQEEHYGRL